MRLKKIALLAVTLLTATERISSAVLPTPRLIVVISIDQMRYDFLTRFQPLYKGGFRALLGRGAVFTNALYRHASTETGPGHSVILSGRHPASSGIVANHWYDPMLKKTVNVVEDPSQAPVGGPGRAASPANFIGFTVGDRIKQKWPKSQVVGLAIPDRAAILMAGRLADAAYWFEPPCGCFITSTYYTPQAPPWLVQFNKLKPADRYWESPWTRLIGDEALYTKYSREDAFPQEWDLKDITFPHAHRGRPPEPAYYDNLRRTPFADELVLQAAMEILKAHEMGADDSPDLLTLSFSSSDLIGHSYGPFSQEAMDAYLRLDLVLERLFKAVEARAGLSQTLLILTADHGVLPLVEWLQKQGIPARRLPASALEKAVTAALKKRYPSASDLVANFEAHAIYLNLESIHRHRLNRSEVEQTAAQALLATGAVAAVYTHGDLLSQRASSDPYISFFRNSFFQPRSPHLTVLPKKYFYIDDHPGGTGHGTPYEYDRHVPIVWMGPHIQPGRHPAPAGPEDIAPTLAKLLGIAYPLEPDSRLLTEVLP